MHVRTFETPTSKQLSPPLKAFPDLIPPANAEERRQPTDRPTTAADDSTATNKDPMEMRRKESGGLVRVQGFDGEYAVPALECTMSVNTQKVEDG